MACLTRRTGDCPTLSPGPERRTCGPTRWWNGCWPRCWTPGGRRPRAGGVGLPGSTALELTYVVNALSFVGAPPRCSSGGRMSIWDGTNTATAQRRQNLRFQSQISEISQHRTKTRIVGKRGPLPGKRADWVMAVTLRNCCAVLNCWVRVWAMEREKNGSAVRLREAPRILRWSGA